MECDLSRKRARVSGTHSGFDNEMANSSTAKHSNHDEELTERQLLEVKATHHRDTVTSAAAAHRTFYSWPELQQRVQQQQQQNEDDNESKQISTKIVQQDAAIGTLVQRINQSIMGNNTPFQSPFGRRQILYADYVGSAKSLTFIENYISDNVLPTYANTHSTGYLCALQTTMFRHEARQIIREAVNASADDALIFCPSGTTTAMNKLVRCLTTASRGENSSKKLIVFCSLYEHHSNLLPWREVSGAEIRVIGEDNTGQFDYDSLEIQLKQLSITKNDYQIIGAFSACSNVTGILLDVDRLSRLLHEHNALAIFDYAACAPYVPIDMNPLERKCSKDAIVFSMHKFIGGPQTPGVLVVKKRLLNNSKPDACGGGTVFFVSNDSHRYLLDVETREEGGTPAIIESIRAGLIFKLKQSIGVDVIMHRERLLWQRARERLAKISNLLVLGPVDSVDRLPIISFVVRHAQTGLLLHHHFIVAVLNDVFGLQMRGGCMCAGPYAQHLLGIDLKLAQQFENVLLEDARFNEADRRGPNAPPREFSVREHLRPGFVRFNLPYFMTDAECDFIFSALELVAVSGWQLLPQYLLNPETGEWHHRDQRHFAERKWLSSLNFFAAPTTTKLPEEKQPALNFQKCLNEAREKIFCRDICRQMAYRHRAGEEFSASSSSSHDENAARKLIWFLLPSEARALLLNDNEFISSRKPVFMPRQYRRLQQNVVAVSAENCCDISSTKIDGDAVIEQKSSLQLPQQLPPLSALPQSHRWWGPSKRIWKKLICAIKDFDMIRNNDRVLVCLSGGKDSLTLLHALRQFKLYGKANGIEFQLGAVTVDPGSTSFDPKPLKPYLAALGGVPYFYEQHNIMQTAESIENLASICSFCSRMKRGTLYSCARREGYNVLAIGQHLDDFAESFIMSCFCNGKIRTMKAHYTIAAKDALRVIRPLVYVRERDTRQFAQQRALPVIVDNCPACYTAPEMRHRIKQMLASQELLLPNVFDSLLAALKPFIAIHSVDVENSLRQLPMLLKYKAAYEQLHGGEKAIQNGSKEPRAEEIITDDADDVAAMN